MRTRREARRRAFEAFRLRRGPPDFGKRAFALTIPT